jgi:hypothetical protein
VQQEEHERQKEKRKKKWQCQWWGDEGKKEMKEGRHGAL